MSDLWDRLVAEIGFLEIVREESKRTIYCEPHRVDQVRAAVDQYGASDLLTVRANPICGPGQLIVMDEGALKAAGREAERKFLQGLVWQPWRFGGTT